LDGWGLGRVLGQRQVCSDAIVVTRVRAQHMAEMTVADRVTGILVAELVP